MISIIYMYQYLWIGLFLIYDFNVASWIDLFANNSAGIPILLLYAALDTSVSGNILLSKIVYFSSNSVNSLFLIFNCV